MAQSGFKGAVSQHRMHNPDGGNAPVILVIEKSIIKKIAQRRRLTTAELAQIVEGALDLDDDTYNRMGTRDLRYFAETCGQELAQQVLARRRERNKDT